MKVPALHGHARFCACLAAQREDAGGKRQLAQGHAVDKILASAKDRVVDLDHVVAVAGNFIVQHRIGMEAETAGAGQFLALRVAEPDRGLEPPRHGVGNVRHQLLGTDRKDQLLPLGCREAIAIDLPGQDLPIDDRRKLDVDDRLRAGAKAPFFLLRAERLPSGKIIHVDRFVNDFRQTADLKDQGVRQSRGPLQPQLADTGLGIGRRGDVQHGRFGDGRIGRPVVEFCQLLADLEDRLLFLRSSRAIYFAAKRHGPPHPLPLSQRERGVYCSACRRVCPVQRPRAASGRPAP